MRHATQDVIGSWIVYDPTGRDLAECMEAAEITRCYFADGDDGDTGSDFARMDDAGLAAVLTRYYDTANPIDTDAMVAAENEVCIRAHIPPGYTEQGITTNGQRMIDAWIAESLPTMETALQDPRALEHLAEIAQLASLARTALDDPGGIAHLGDDMDANRAYAIDRLDEIIQRARDAGALQD